MVVTVVSDCVAVVVTETVCVSVSVVGVARVDLVTSVVVLGHD